MNLNLKNPLVFFDLETTGTNITTDRIIELAYVKVFPNGKTEEKDIYISRRTVTKYREECFIYNSRQRKIEKILWEEK